MSKELPDLQTAHLPWSPATPRSLGLVFLVALGLRLAAVLSFGLSTTDFGDAASYLETADFVCREIDYPSTSNLPFFRAPGLPLFICLVTACSPEQVVVVKVGLAVVDSLTVLAIWGLARVLTRSGFIALVSAALAALNPLFVAQATEIRTEPLFMAHLTCGLVLFLVAVDDRRWRFLPAAAGGVLGLAALTRPVALAAVGFMAVALFLKRQGERGPGRLGAPLLLVGGTAAVLCPWILFMYAKYGELVVVNDAGGYNLWRGFHPELARALMADDRAEYLQISTHFEQVTSPSEATRVSREASTPMSRSRVWRQRAVEGVLAHPGRSLYLLAWKTLQFWRPWLNPLEHPWPRVLLSACLGVFLYSCGVLGLCQLRKKDRWTFWFIVAWFGLACVIHLPFQVVMRFRLPFTDPLLTVLCALALAGRCRATMCRDRRVLTS